MNKAIYFDMDNTIADLYHVENWLARLRAEEVEPYLEAEPIYSLDDLNWVLNELAKKGWIIGIISWLSKEGGKRYLDRIRYAKKKWLSWYCHFPIHEMHFTKYGKSKYHFAKVKNAILIDDNAEVRTDWESQGGIAINPDENLITYLRSWGN